ncbi:MAG: hypothetical protein HUK03_10475, partial [Bacteroidaceae bacterium]|nr:hypothetical protein [Bacteroidaceae bacterium]
MLEFRQRIWKRIGATAWMSAGNVFGREAFSWGHWLPDFGVGFRWEFKQRVNVRIDCGFGKADSKGNTTWNICFNINEAF